MNFLHRKVNKNTALKKMYQTLGTFVLNVGDECTEHWGRMY